jgi:hypothetical protein
MGASRGARALISSIALIALLAGASGCFGYNRSAKRWAYVGDAVLILGGGAAIATDLTSKSTPCSGDNCPYQSSIHGTMVAGVILVAAGLFGLVFNATRDNVKSSH